MATSPPTSSRGGGGSGSGNPVIVPGEGTGVLALSEEDLAFLLQELGKGSVVALVKAWNAGLMWDSKDAKTDIREMTPENWKALARRLQQQQLDAAKLGAGGGDETGGVGRKVISPRYVDMESLERRGTFSVGFSKEEGDGGDRSGGDDPSPRTRGRPRSQSQSAVSRGRIGHVSNIINANDSNGVGITVSVSGSGSGSGGSSNANSIQRPMPPNFRIPMALSPRGLRTMLDKDKDTEKEQEKEKGKDEKEKENEQDKDKEKVKETEKDEETKTKEKEKEKEKENKDKEEGDGDKAERKLKKSKDKAKRRSLSEKSSPTLKPKTEISNSKEEEEEKEKLITRGSSADDVDAVVPSTTSAKKQRNKHQRVKSDETVSHSVKKEKEKDKEKEKEKEKRFSQSGKDIDGEKDVHEKGDHATVSIAEQQQDSESESDDEISAPPPHVTEISSSPSSPASSSPPTSLNNSSSSSSSSPSSSGKKKLSRRGLFKKHSEKEKKEKEGMTVSYEALPMSSGGLRSKKNLGSAAGTGSGSGGGSGGGGGIGMIAAATDARKAKPLHGRSASWGDNFKLHALIQKGSKILHGPNDQSGQQGGGGGSGIGGVGSGEEVATSPLGKRRKKGVSSGVMRKERAEKNREAAANALVEKAKEKEKDKEKEKERPKMQRKKSGSFIVPQKNKDKRDKVSHPTTTTASTSNEISSQSTTTERIDRPEIPIEERGKLMRQNSEHIDRLLVRRPSYQDMVANGIIREWGDESASSYSSGVDSDTSTSDTNSSETATIRRTTSDSISSNEIVPVSSSKNSSSSPIRGSSPSSTRRSGSPSSVRARPKSMTMVSSTLVDKQQQQKRKGTSSSSSSSSPSSSRRRRLPPLINNVKLEPDDPEWHVERGSVADFVAGAYCALENDHELVPYYKKYFFGKGILFFLSPFYL